MNKKKLKSVCLLPIFMVTIVAWSCSSNEEEDLMYSSNEASIPRFRTSSEGESIYYPRVNIGVLPYERACPLEGHNLSYRPWVSWIFVKGGAPTILNVSVEVTNIPSSYGRPIPPCTYKDQLNSMLIGNSYVEMIDSEPICDIYKSTSEVWVFSNGSTDIKFIVTSVMACNSNLGLMPAVRLVNDPSGTKLAPYF